ncbi:hypothetical protein GE21DRAFT_1210352 [Neurospora crassa]|nr:hypothetical protein GE21DRAFT_1210352 [Neurospora crassa]
MVKRAVSFPVGNYISHPPSGECATIFCPQSQSDRAWKPLTPQGSSALADGGICVSEWLKSRFRD